MHDKPVDKLRERITEAAQEVFKELGAGHLESVYEKAMSIEFKERSIGYEVWKGKQVIYKGVQVGVDRPDFVIQDQLAVEIKTGERISGALRGGMWSYLRSAKLEFGMIVNFPYSKDYQLDFVNIPEQISDTSAENKSKKQS